MITRFTNYLREKRKNPEYRKREKLAEIAADLRILLADVGLSQRDMAARLGLSDQALSKKLGGANLSLGALFDYCEALGKEFDITYRTKGDRRVSSLGANTTLESPYVFDQSLRMATRPPIALCAENDEGYDDWRSMKIVGRR